MTTDKKQEKFQKGDAGTAGPSNGLSSESSITYPIIEEDPAVSITGTEADMSGRVIPQGGFEDSVAIRELGRFFDVPADNFLDSARDLQEVLTIMREITSLSAMSDLLPAIREMEDKLRPPHATTTRLKHFYNYLLEKQVEEEVRKKVKAWEV